MDNDTSFKTVQIGTLIYRGFKEESIEAIKKKTSEVIKVIVDNSDAILQLQNLSDHCLENISLRQLYSRKRGPEDLLIFTDNFNSLLKRLSEVENVISVLPSSRIPEYLLKRAYEIKKKLDAVDLAVSELRTKYQTVGVIKSFRNELLPEACNMVNQTHIFDYATFFL